MSEDASVNTGAVHWPDEDQAWWAVRRMQTKLHCCVCRGDPLQLGPAGTLQREGQALPAQPQPGRAHRPAAGEPGEDRVNHAGDRLVGMQPDLTDLLTPDQSDRQTAAQLATLGLVPDPAVQAGAQHVQLSLWPSCP